MRRIETETRTETEEIKMIENQEMTETERKTENVSIGTIKRETASEGTEMIRIGIEREDMAMIKIKKESVGAEMKKSETVIVSIVTIKIEMVNVSTEMIKRREIGTETINPGTRKGIGMIAKGDIVTIKEMVSAGSIETMTRTGTVKMIGMIKGVMTIGIASIEMTRIESGTVNTEMRRTKIGTDGTGMTKTGTESIGMRKTKKGDTEMIRIASAGIVMMIAIRNTAMKIKIARDGIAMTKINMMMVTREGGVMRRIGNTGMIRRRGEMKRNLIEEEKIERTKRADRRSIKKSPETKADHPRLVIYHFKWNISKIGMDNY